MRFSNEACHDQFDWLPFHTDAIAGPSCHALPVVFFLPFFLICYLMPAHETSHKSILLKHPSGAEAEVRLFGTI